LNQISIKREKEEQKNLKYSSYPPLILSQVRAVLSLNLSITPPAQATAETQLTIKELQ